MSRTQRKWGWKTSWFHCNDTLKENGLYREGVVQAKEDDPLSAIVAAYQQQHGWKEKSVDEWFNCPTEAEIQEDLVGDEDELTVGFLGGSSGGNEYNIRVWKVEDDTPAGMKEEKDSSATGTGG
jgi:hypothetical protein